MISKLKEVMCSFTVHGFPRKLRDAFTGRARAEGSTAKEKLIKLMEKGLKENSNDRKKKTNR